MKFFLSFAATIIFVLILTAIPGSFDFDSYLYLNLDVLLDTVKNYFIGMQTGETWYFYEGLDRKHSFFAVIGSYFLTSFSYIFFAAAASIIIGMFIASWHSRSKKEWMKDIIGFSGMIPDFLLVLILQILTVLFYQTTGHRLARIATRGASEPAILLPLITLTLVPAIYLIRSLSERTYDVLAEDYILTAKGKGLSRIYIFMQHVVRNVLPFLKADLHKVLAILMSNLFVVEYLFNLQGVAGFLFASGDFGYQYNLTANTLILMVMMYMLLYWCCRCFVVLLERIFAHG